MGAIAGVTAGTTVAAVAVSGTVTMAMYAPGEWLGGTDFGSEHEGASNALVGIGGDFVANGGSSSVINQNVGNLARGAAQYGSSQVTGNVGKGLEGAIRHAISHNNLKAGGGYTSIAGVLGNITIGAISDKYENTLAAETLEQAEFYNTLDKNNGIDVIATEA